MRQRNWILALVFLSLTSMTMGLGVLDGCTDTFPSAIVDTIRIVHSDTTIIDTTFAGWTLSTQDTARSFYVVNFTNSQLGVVAGDSGVVMLSTDGALTWQRLTTPTTSSLYCAHFFDSDTGIVAGNEMFVYRTTDKGATWTPIQAEADNSLVFRSMYFLDTSFGFMTAGGNAGSTGALFQTLDAGRTWTKILQSPGGSLYGIAFSDGDNGVVTGARNVLLRTSDRGTTWTNVYTQVSDVIQSPAYITPNIIVASCYANNTSGYFIRSTDAGLTWTKGPLYPFGLQAVAASINSTTMAGWGGDVLSSIDYGLSWTHSKLPYDRIVGGTNVGRNTILLVGSHGSITRRDGF